MLSSMKILSEKGNPSCRMAGAAKEILPLLPDAQKGNELDHWIGRAPAC